MTKSEARYFGVMLEEIRDQNRAVLEAVGDMQWQIKHIFERPEFVALKNEVRLMNRAIIENRHDHDVLEKRVVCPEKHTGLAA